LVNFCGFIQNIKGGGRFLRHSVDYLSCTLSVLKVLFEQILCKFYDRRKHGRNAVTLLQG